MKFLIKLFCLLSLVSSFAFSDYKKIAAFTDDYLKTLSKVDNIDEYGFIDNEKYFFVKSSKDNYNYVVFVSDIEPYYVLDRSFQAGVYNYDGNNFLTDGIYKTGLFSFKQQLFDTTYYYFGFGDTHNYSIFYKIGRSNAISCKYSENVDLKSWQCVPACPAGQSWDIENGICYSDCTDKDLNKFGYSNGTAQGGCVDCSNALANQEIASCICSGFGSTLPDSMVFINAPDSPFISTSCSDGSSITFKKRSNENPDKDKEKDKENSNSDKDKDKKNDNNSTSSSDKDKENPKPDKDKENPNPDKKDNNENSNNSSGESGNSSNNNSGGSSGNGSSGGGGTGVETKPNPNYKGDGKEDGKGDGKQDGKGEEGKGDDAVAQKLDYGDLEKDADKFNSDFKGALDSVISQAQDFKNSLNDTISKIKDGGLTKFNQSAIPSTCPLNYKINLIYFEKDVTFDICKIISPASQILYYFFYVVFFVLFLIVTIKLFLFTF